MQTSFSLMLNPTGLESNLRAGHIPVPPVAIGNWLTIGQQECPNRTRVDEITLSRNGAGRKVFAINTIYGSREENHALRV